MRKIHKFCKSFYRIKKFKFKPIKIFNCIKKNRLNIIVKKQNFILKIWIVSWGTT